VAYTDSTVAQFQTQFSRDFPYSNDPSLGVTPADIITAFNMADIAINQGMWSSQSQYNIGFNLLAAHFLVLNLRAATQGLNGQFNWAQNSKSVGNVSESFTIPQRLIDNPELMQYAKTNYGAQYLQLLWPQLCGQILIVNGGSQP